MFSRQERIGKAGFERRSKIERHFLHSSAIFKTSKDNKSLEDININTRPRVLFERTNNYTDKMGSDEDYMAFLDKANEDPSAGTSKATSNNKKAEFKTMDDDVDVPSVLVRATKDAWYTSDADEPFVVVALKCEGGMPNEGLFFVLY